MGWIEMNEKMKKAKKAQKTKAASLADRYSFGHKALSVVLSVVLLGFGWPAVNPVSYTHLDVYKRQVLHGRWKNDLALR